MSESRPWDGDTPVRPIWYTLAKYELARQVHEVPGIGVHPRIAEYLKIVDHGGEDDSTTPWCAAFVSWVLEQANVRSTRSASARSYLHWGQGIEQPRIGCVVVFSRPPNPAHGHVAFYVGETKTHVECLGGNQGNAVSLAYYAKERVLSYRWPKDA